MNKAQAAQIHEALQITLKKFAEENGLVCLGANTKWSAEGLRTGIIEFVEKDLAKAKSDVQNTESDPRWKKDFHNNAWELRLTDEMLGKEHSPRKSRPRQAHPARHARIEDCDEGHRRQAVSLAELDCTEADQPIRRQVIQTEPKALSLLERRWINAKRT